MNRLERHLSERRAAGRKSLAMYLTPFFPEADSTVELALALADAGADVLELGIPFSDPIADGPVIQASSELALGNGATLEGVLALAAEIRAAREIPIVLMGYANPVYHFGLTRFLQACAAHGVDGTIVPDIPLEESTDLRAAAQAHGVANILLASPTTSDARLAALDEATRGFLYAVSVAGVTGARSDITAASGAFLERARRVVQVHPLLVGFGIGTPEDARRVSAHADGVIVGSALLSLLTQSPRAERVTRAAAFTRSLRAGLDGGAS